MQTGVDDRLAAGADRKPSPFSGPEWAALDAALRRLAERVDVALGGPTKSDAPPDHTLLDEAMEVRANLHDLAKRWRDAVDAGRVAQDWDDSKAMQGWIGRWHAPAARLLAALNRSGRRRDYPPAEQFAEAVVTAWFESTDDLDRLRATFERMDELSASRRNGDVKHVGG